jgi:hypothetical protein
MWKTLSPVVLSAALGACGPAMYTGQSSYDQQYEYTRIHPDISAPGTSWGGTRSERVDNETGVPLPEGSSFAGTVAMGEWHGVSRAESSVIELEEALVQRGYDPGIVDGRMDENTRHALAQLQRDAGLRVTGVVDGETAQALGLHYMG